MKQKCYGNLDKRSDLSSSQSLGVSNYKLKNQRVGFDLFQKKKKNSKWFFNIDETKMWWKFRQK